MTFYKQKYILFGVTKFRSRENVPRKLRSKYGQLHVNYWMKIYFNLYNFHLWKYDRILPIKDSDRMIPRFDKEQVFRIVENIGIIHFFGGIFFEGN